MSGPDLLEAARPLLEALERAGVPFLVIGTAALTRLRPELLTAPPRDVDLLLPDALPALEGFARAAAALGWEVTSWDEPVAPPLDPLVLRGRFYLRARRPPGPVVDATYECAPLPWDEALLRAGRADGLPMAALEDVLHLKAVRGAERDLEVLERARRLGLAWRRPG